MKYLFVASVVNGVGESFDQVSNLLSSQSQVLTLLNCFGNNLLHRLGHDRVFAIVKGVGLAGGLAVGVAASGVDLQCHIRKLSGTVDVANLRSRGETPQDPWARPLVPCWGQRFVRWRGKRPGRAGWWKTF
jgi:hypothetical protein